MTIDGFRARHGHWPTQVRLPAACLGNIRDALFTPDDYTSIVAKITFVEDETCMMASDADGRTHSYDGVGHLKPPSPSAAEWLGVGPKREQH